MYIVETSPLKYIKGFKSLSYFSAHKFKKFDIVEAPFRNSKIDVLVLSVKELKSVKADIKDKNFAPKKIRKQNPRQIFDKDFLRAADSLSKECLTPTGAIVGQIAPSALLKHSKNSDLTIQNKSARASNPDKIHQMILNEFEDGRLDSYKALVRQKLAQSESVFIVCPNTKVAKKIHDFLSPGISSMMIFYDSSASPKKQYEQIQKINSSKVAKCIVGTPGILSSQPCNLGLIIVEKEHSISYKYKKYPKMNARDFAKALAQEKNIDILFADTLPRLENYMELVRENAISITHTPRRLRKSVKLRIIDLKKEIKYNKEYNLQYPVVSREILGEIKKYATMGKKMFIFNPKKHYANQIICNDCATVIKCPKCSAGLKLQKLKNSDERRLLCDRCGFAKRSNITCPNCASWRLQDLGVGIDKVHEFLKKNFPDLPIEVFDSEHIKSEKEAKLAIENFYSKDGATVLLGTFKALSFLDANSVSYAAALSVDSLLSVPDFQMEEKIYYTLADILDKSCEAFDVQVKNINERVIKHFAKKDFQKFIKEELSLRENLMWPPYTRLIKVSVEGTRKDCIERMQNFINIFAKYKPRVFRDFKYLDKNKVELSALLRVDSALWPGGAKELWQDLHSLSSDFKISVDPEGLD